LETRLGRRSKSIEVWLRDGTLAYSNANKHRIGAKSPPSGIHDALLGQVTATIRESADQRSPRHVIEVYAPLFRSGTKDVIAAGKVINDGERLAGELQDIRLASAALVAAATAPMMLVLYLLVKRAARTVKKHRIALKRKVAETTALAVLSGKLRQEADDARIEAVQSNERFLNQIGQDLHDGPIQLLTVLGLRLGEPRDSETTDDRRPSFADVDELLSGALAELRDIATGVVLPQLNDLSTSETLRLAVQQHEGRTDTTVTCRIDTLPSCPTPLRVCLFRVVQESLSNAYQHAGGNGQALDASYTNGLLGITIRDSGPGSTTFQQLPKRNGYAGLGLNGLRRRVAAFNGSLDVISQTDGTQVSVKIPVVEAEVGNAPALANQFASRLT
jgi:signal transduction histidine kinase